MIRNNNNQTRGISIASIKYSNSKHFVKASWAGEFGELIFYY